jgi:uncharacterized caspase-like protein
MVRSARGTLRSPAGAFFRNAEVVERVDMQKIMPVLAGLVVFTAGCTSLKIGPTVTEFPEPPPKSVLRLDGVTEEITGSWERVQGKSAFMHSFKQALEKTRAGDLFSPRPEALSTTIALTSDHSDDGPRLVLHGMLSMGTLGIIPLRYYSEWNVQCDVTVTMSDGSLVGKYPLHETGTFDYRTGPPTWLYLIAMMPQGENRWFQVQECVGKALAAKLVDTINDDYERLVKAQAVNAARLTGRPAAAMPSTVPTVTLPPPTGKRWAIVIGLSEYQHAGKWNLTNLRYAARDAAALAAYLKRETGGRFDSVEMLLNKEATTRNIKMALRERLRSAQQSDFVVIFWAGHGAPDPGDPECHYLVTYDTDPEHMASTGYSMAELREDIGRLKPEKLLVLADTCHAAGIGNPNIGLRGPEDNKIVDRFRGLRVAPRDETGAGGPMRMIFTSCESGESSQESADLGGGHGVFTWFLLQGLGGEADDAKTGGNSDGVITLGETIEYARDQVKRYTQNRQHPDTAGRFDRNLVMGRRAGQ